MSESKKVEIRLTQFNPTKNIEKLEIVNKEYVIKKCTAIKTEKLTQSITKAVFRRVNFEKTVTKTGFKCSKPMVLTVSVDGKYLINTDELSMSTGTQAKVKVNSSLLAKDHAKEKKRFQDVLTFIIEESETLHKELKACFYNPDKVKATEPENIQE